MRLPLLTFGAPPCVPVGATVWGGPSHCWLHNLLAQAAWQLQASCAFPWQSPWPQAWLALAFICQWPATLLLPGSHCLAHPAPLLLARHADGHEDLVKCSPGKPNEC